MRRGSSSTRYFGKSFATRTDIGQEAHGAPVTPNAVPNSATRKAFAPHSPVMDSQSGPPSGATSSPKREKGQRGRPTIDYLGTALLAGATGGTGGLR